MTQNEQKEAISDPKRAVYAPNEAEEKVLHNATGEGETYNCSNCGKALRKGRYGLVPNQGLCLMCWVHAHSPTKDPLICRCGWPKGHRGGCFDPYKGEGS